jgi:hypothetical protein
MPLLLPFAAHTVTHSISFTALAMSIRYIGQKLAQHIDEELMSAAGAFSLDQVSSQGDTTPSVAD